MVLFPRKLTLRTVTAVKAGALVSGYFFKDIRQKRCHFL